VKIIIFLFLNFLALAIGSYFTGSGVSSDWYQQLNKAPWTPPGWVFGAAWTSIMILYALFMVYVSQHFPNQKQWIAVFSVQWVLNIIWNPIFFEMKAILSGLICISLLTLFIFYQLIKYKSKLEFKSWLIAPYLVWLLIATSLNAYILFNN